MKELIERLVGIGYSQEEAKNLYVIYELGDDIDGLKAYVYAKESTMKTL